MDEEDTGQVSAGQRVRNHRHSPANRELITTSRQEQLSNWCDDNAPIKSGSLDEAHLRFSTFSKAYEAYNKEVRGSRSRPFSFSSFCGLLYKWAVSPMRFDTYSCPLCYALYSSHKSILEMENDPHTIQQANIWPEYTKQVDELKQGNANHVIVIMDYSRVHELGAVRSEEGEPASKLSILNFTVITNGNNESAFDYFATGHQGPAFMKKSMIHLADHLTDLAQDAKHINFWSDGGLKTYGTVGNVLSLSNRLNKTILHHFFPPYHGHSRCDSHFGRGKRELRKKYPNGGLNTFFQVMETFAGLPATFTDLISLKGSVVGSYSGQWPNGIGIRSCDVVKYYHGQIYVKSLKSVQEPSWKLVEEPSWTENANPHRLLKVVPYTPIGDSIPDPVAHRESFMSRIPTVGYSRKEGPFTKFIAYQPPSIITTAALTLPSSASVQYVTSLVNTPLLILDQRSNLSLFKDYHQPQYQWFPLETSP